MSVTIDLQSLISWSPLAIGTFAPQLAGYTDCIPRGRLYSDEADAVTVMFDADSVSNGTTCSEAF